MNDCKSILLAKVYFLAMLTTLIVLAGSSEASQHFKVIKERIWTGSQSR